MKKTNNKGFSLVELIIVIAIMAILAGAIAPALIRYIDKSRKSNDVSACKTIKTAIETAMSNEEAHEALTPVSGINVLTIQANKKVATTGNESEAPSDTTTGAISMSAAGTTDTNAKNTALTEIAKNLGGKTPKISYKKKAKGVESSTVPTTFYAVVDADGTIYVGVGSAAPAEAQITPDNDGKYPCANTFHLIVPEVCDHYAK